MTATEVGTKLVDLINAGDYATIYGTLYSPEIVSIESDGDATKYVGMEAINAKNEWWNANFEVHSTSVEGPFPNGDQFALIIEMDVTAKEGNHRFPMKEIAVYTAAEGKIVRESFFYQGDF